MSRETLPEQNNSEENPTLDHPAADAVEEQSALKPLVYILILPFALIALLQWSGLPRVILQAVTGP